MTERPGPRPVSARSTDGRRRRSDGGFVSAIEVVYVAVAALVAVVFLGFLGRLAASGVQVTNAAQDSARAASLAGDPERARAAATAAVGRSGLPARCQGSPVAELSWSPSELGTWQGAVVTVRVSCTIANQTLTGGVWSPGARTIRASDSQVVERFRR